MKPMSKKKEDVMPILRTVLDQERAEALFFHRETIKKAPLSTHTAKLLCKKFVEFGNPNEAADIMMDNDWRGFKIPWGKKAQAAETELISNRPAQGRHRQGGLFDAAFKTGFGMERSDVETNGTAYPGNVERASFSPRQGPRIEH